jgi:hypothetical protein
LLLVAVHGSAGTKYFVKIDSICDPDKISAGAYVVYPATEDVHPEDLQFREFTKYIHRALRAKGFAPVEGAAKPEIVVFLSYGIEGPRDTIRSVPIVGKVPTTQGQKPQWGVVGSAAKSEPQFDRWIILEAIDAKPLLQTGTVVQVWRTTVTSSGRSSDLRAVFPIMIAAAKPFIATNTEKQVLRKLGEKSPEVAAIRGENSH